jgi:tRNA pseudouridine55 synthase
LPDDNKMGFLNVNKPLKLTSHDVVARVRRRYKELTGSRKIGHAGTLDPLATGVLVLCLGGATRLSDYVMHTTKQYRARITLGQTTTTYDAEGDVMTETDASHITQDDVEAILLQFTGDIQQIPPMYSAIKVDGKKLYDLARDGKSIERKARNITISSLQVLSWDSPTFELDVVCSSGTYIRSLAYDIGQVLGVGAYLSGLERVASGNFHVESSIKLDNIMNNDAWHQQIILPQDALKDRPSITLTPENLELVQNGQFIKRTTNNDVEFMFAYTEDGQFAAILTPRDKFWKPHKVFLR